MHGTRVSVGVTHDVAGEAEGIVRQVHLSEQGGGQVRLVANFGDDAGRADSAANPNHGNVRASFVAVGNPLGIVDAVVGQENHEQVFPRLRFFQFFHEASDAVVQIGEGIGFLVVGQAGVGHLPRLVAGECEETDVPGFLLWTSDDALEERVKGNGVGDAPVVGVACFGGEPGVAGGAPIAG